MSKKRKQYKFRALLQDRCRCCSEFRGLIRTFPHASNSEPFLLLMMEGRSRADVATLQRHDVETSRRYCLLTFTIVDPTSRRWDVTTWGRHDVGTSRRLNVATLQPISCIAFHCSNLLPNFALFTSFEPAFTELSTLRYRAIKIRI